jgi:hypothetical protein
VAAILPAGYERYLRLFHPIAMSDDGVRVTPRTWKSVADESGLVYHGELQWDSLRPKVVLPIDGRPAQFVAFLQDCPADLESESAASLGRWPIEGTLGEPARSRLYGLLAAATSSEVFFYFGVAASFLCLTELLYRGPATALEEIQLLANARATHQPQTIPGPEYVWPMDRSWMVQTDCDLISTYIACDSTMAAQLLADDVLEILPVSLETRIDTYADQINQGNRLRDRA